MVGNSMAMNDDNVQSQPLLRFWSWQMAYLMLADEAITVWTKNLDSFLRQAALRPHRILLRRQQLVILPRGYSFSDHYCHGRARTTNCCLLDVWHLIQELTKELFTFIMYVCMYVCIHVCMYVYMYVCMYVCLFVCMYVCMYVCLRWMQVIDGCRSSNQLWTL
jgi:hypothetical protein